MSSIYYDLKIPRRVSVLGSAASGLFQAVALSASGGLTLPAVAPAVGGFPAALLGGSAGRGGLWRGRL